MDKSGLYFSIKDTIQGEPVGLKNASFSIIQELIDIAKKFVKGSDNINTKDLPVILQEGSVAIAIPINPSIQSAMHDYAIVRETGNINGIDPIRAHIFKDLQRQANKSQNRIYTISDDITFSHVNISNAIVIDRNSDFKDIETDDWIDTEIYLYGKVFDMGGKTPNVHIELQNGDSITVDANVDFIKDDIENRLYKPQLVRVKAEQNARTKQLRNESLISFERYNPKFDEADFERLVRKETEAWKDIPDVVEWVESLRGNNVTA